MTKRKSARKWEGGSYFRLWLSAVLAASLTAQDLAPVGIVRGSLLRCDTTHITLDDEKNHTFTFVTDGRTFIERGYQRVSCAKLSKGDSLEIVSDVASRPDARYARMVKVMDFEALQRRRTPGVPHGTILSDEPTSHIAPRGPLALSGVILRVEPAGLVLRTRQWGEKWILLRIDTRYRQDGLRVDSSSLAVHRQVFIRARMNPDGDLEAYEVVWGDILAPAGVR